LSRKRVKPCRFDVRERVSVVEDDGGCVQSLFILVFLSHLIEYLGVILDRKLTRNPHILLPNYEKAKSSIPIDQLTNIIKSKVLKTTSNASWIVCNDALPATHNN